MKILIENKFKHKIIKFKYNKFIKQRKSTMYFINNIYTNKNSIFYFALKKIKGINFSTAYLLLTNLGVSLNTKTYNLKKYKNIFNILIPKILFNKNKIFIESSVFKNRKENMLKKIHSGNYQGNRHLLNLPVKGQKTKTNAKTRKKFKII